MRALDRARLRLRSWFNRQHVEDELESELRFHIDALTDEYLAMGASAMKLTDRRDGKWEVWPGLRRNAAT